MADSEEKLQRLVEKLAVECYAVGLRINIGKKETMIVNKKKRRNECEHQHTESGSKASKIIQLSG
jgi:hypothetical protein